MIRVGRCIYDKKGKRTDPSYPGFTSIVVLMSSHSEWGSLGPYNLKNEKGQIFENYYQYHRLYEKVPATTQYYSRWSDKVTWQHPAEVHIDPITGEANEAYWKWREKGMNNKYYIRYPVGFSYRHNVKYTLWQNEKGEYEKLDYIQSRKRIYVKEYTRLVRQQPKFNELQDRLKSGENLLIIEVDGPCEEHMDYYKQKYGVSDDFIVNNTMLVTEDNMKIMLNDPLKPYGHGYCLAMALLDKHEEWNANYQPKNESNKEPNKEPKNESNKEPKKDSNKEPKKEPKKDLKDEQKKDQKKKKVKNSKDEKETSKKIIVKGKNNNNK